MLVKLEDNDRFRWRVLSRISSLKYWVIFLRLLREISEAGLRSNSLRNLNGLIRLAWNLLIARKFRVSSLRDNLQVVRNRLLIFCFLSAHWFKFSPETPLDFINNVWNVKAGGKGLLWRLGRNDKFFNILLILKFFEFFYDSKTIKEICFNKKKKFPSGSGKILSDLRVNLRYLENLT